MKKRKSNFYDENGEMKESVKRNMGRWKNTPGAAKESSEKGAAVLKKQAAARRALKDKAEFINQSLAAAMEDNMDFMSNMIKMFMGIMNDPSADPKDRMNAADKLTHIVGLQAPKQSEVKVEHKEMTPEEAKAILMGFDKEQEDGEEARDYN